MIVGIPVWQICLWATPVVLFLWMLEYANSLRERLQPKIELSFEDGWPDVGISGFIRVHATLATGKLAKRCKAYLVGVEMESDGQWRPHVRRQTYQLKWEYKDEAREDPRDLHLGEDAHFDVIKMAPNDEFPMIELSRRTKAQMKTLEQPGRYRMRVKVWNEDVESNELGLIIKFDGNSIIERSVEYGPF